MNNIRHLRKSLSLSQAEMAEQIGVTQSALSQYERQLCDPVIETARRMIVYAGSLGAIWTLDQIYSDPPEPLAEPVATNAEGG
ncbi:helix-turn-helix domain-containing protein [Burkholderia gladioli]|uniref:helix-turn-helix domain-containing protein n=1 Tax=Burkholderia gladioli TaxID=28095 RepID=UPI001640CF1B|nr:helix-turn-helix transcriptional regulator [Burkholderia gladioli]